MDNVPVQLKFIGMFILLNVLVMGVDGLMYDNYNSRPSMALMHMETKPVLYVDPAPPNLDVDDDHDRQTPNSSIGGGMDLDGMDMGGGGGH